MRSRSTFGLFIAGGLVVALAFAFLGSPLASSEPDGLSKVAIDKGSDSTETRHAMSDGPLAGYAVRGIDDDGLSTGVAGVIGVALCFALGTGGLTAVRTIRGRDER